jgi:hypothetical protein
VSVLDRPSAPTVQSQWVLRRQQAVDLPAKNLRPGRTLSKRHVGPARWKHPAACGQEQDCEGSNPMSDAPEKYRGTAEQGRRIAEQRHEGNWRCMIPRPAFPGLSGRTPIFGKAMETPAKNRRGESHDCML